MPVYLPSLPLRWRLPLAAVLLAGLAVPALTSAPALAQNARDTAQLVLRIQDLEQQVRDLTGQVQGLQFQLTQLQTLVDRSNQDNDFRFKALEGGSGGGAGKTDAAGPSGSLSAPASPPQNPGTLRPSAETGDGAPAPTGLRPANGGDGLGPSADPLLGKGRPGMTPGQEEVPLGPPAKRIDNSGQDRPLNLSLAGSGKASNPDAQAQYKAAYDAIVKGDYKFASDQFRQFVKLYPDDPQAPDATNWLGEALLQQQDYVDAADVLVTGYKTYPDSPRAPDMLLKLGIALAGAHQQEAACKTFGLLSQKYPNTTTAFQTRLKQEMARGKCPG
jgi:tol-pal system protein YbgF